MADRQAKEVDHFVDVWPDEMGAQDAAGVRIDQCLKTVDRFRPTALTSIRIEQVFAKIKQLMRRAMERTIEAARDRLTSVLDTITPNECANYFSGAGYAAT